MVNSLEEMDLPESRAFEAELAPSQTSSFNPKALQEALISKDPGSRWLIVRSHLGKAKASRWPSWRWPTIFAWSVMGELNGKAQRNFTSGLLLAAALPSLSSLN